MITLYHFPLSPFCRKVRLSLAEKKLTFEMVEERFWEPSAEFGRRNPARKVPVLRIDGEHLSESAAICEYLEEVHPRPSLLPADPKARAEVRRLVGYFDHTFHEEVTSNLLGEKLYRKIQDDGYPDSASVRTGWSRIRYHLTYMTWLLERRRWLAGPDMTLADFAAAAQLSSLDYIQDVPWDKFEEVRVWYARLKSRPAFRDILRDTIPWQPPPAHYANLDF